MTFNGFISYSHAADDRLAPAIQRGLHRLAKPWHRRRALWIFRDQTGLAVTPALWSSIRNALDGSDFFVLLASPEAARSPWVNREIEHWTATKSATKILPVVTDGEWRWDPRTRDFTDDSTAVPAALRGAFTEEPLYLDLRWARHDQHLSLRHSRFRDAVAQLAAPMHGVSKDELEGEDVRQHKRAQRLRSGALATLVLLTFVAVLTGLMAMRNAERANAAAREARVQQQSAAQQRSSAERSAGEARQQQDLARQQQVKARDAAAETVRQQGLAQRQKVLAAKAAHEADNQQRLAEAQKKLAAQAKADARREQGNAQRQAQLANAAAARAKAQEELAAEQRALAAQWAAEARTQQNAAAEAAAAAHEAQAKVDQQTRTLVGRRLTDQAKTMIGQDPQTALMLGAAADKIQNNDDSQRQLAGLVTSTRYAGTLPASSAEYGPGTDVAVAATTDGLSLWNMTAPSRPVKLSSLPGATGHWVWSPTGRTLAVFPKDGAVTLWDVTDPAHPARLGPLPGLPSVQAVRFSPDGRTLAVYVSSLSRVALWDVSDAARPRPLSTAIEPVGTDAIAFSPDGHTLVTSADINLDVWNVTDPADPVRVASMEADAFSPAAFSPTRPILFVSEGLIGTVAVYDLSTPAQPKAIGSLTAPQGLLSMTFSPDGQVLTTGDYTSEAVRWNVSNPAKPVVLDKMTTDDVVNGLSYDRDGRTLLVTTPLSTTMWSTTDVGAPRAAGTLDGVTGAVVAAYGPDGRSWTAVDSDGTASVWDLTRPAAPVRRATVKVFDGNVYSADISPDRHTVAAAGDYSRDLIRLTDVTDPQRPATLTDLPVAGLTRWEMFDDLRFSADGHRLVAVTSSSRMFLYDLTDRSRPQLLAGPVVTDDDSFAFSPDGRTLAGGNPYGGASLWDITRPSAPVKLVDLGRDRAHIVNSVSVSFSPDGRTLVTEGTNSNTAALWNVSDRLHPVQVGTVPAAVATVSPDNRMLLTNNGTGSVLWDISDPAKPLRVGSAAGWPLGLSPDGHRLITGGATLWDFADLNAIRANPAGQACTVTGRGLTADEWRTYVPELPYQPTCR